MYLKNLISKLLIKKYAIQALAIVLLYAGFASEGLALAPKDEHQAAALGKLVYNYERGANRGRVRAAANLAQVLPIDSHPQEVLDLVAAAAGQNGIMDFESSLLAMATAATNYGFGSELAELAALLGSDPSPGPDPEPEPDPLPALNWEQIVAELYGQLFFYMDPTGTPEFEFIGRSSVIEGSEVIGYEVYFSQLLDPIANTHLIITFHLDIEGNVTNVTTS